MKKILYHAGITEDGLWVLGGCFQLVDSIGFPLECLLEWCRHNHHVVHWVEFLDATLEANWKWKSTRTKIHMAVSEVYGRKYAQEFMSRVDNWEIARMVER
jgi:hypothetical protein